MFEQIYQIIKDFNSIVIFGHKDPDGDCYGAQVALKEIIKTNFPNKDVYIVGNGYHRFFNTITKMDIISDEVVSSSLAVLVDGNDCDRMEDQRVYKAKAWCKIDHHVDTGTFNNGPFVVNEKATSTCEMIIDFVHEFNLVVNVIACNALYLGLLTDSGRFQYVDNYEKIFKDAIFLIQNGADPKTINRLLNLTDEKLLAFKGFIYSNYYKTEIGTMYVAISKESRRKYGVSSARASSLVNLISNLSGYPIWLFCVENDDGSMHIEIRSNGPLVQPIALLYGGGGHRLAAGATLPYFNEEIIKDIVKHCDEAIINQRKVK